MAVKNRIVDGTGQGDEVHVTVDKAILTTEFPCPPLLPQKNRIFKQYLTSDGLAADGTNNDMQVNASLTNPSEFYVKADADADRYITTVSFVIADDGAELDEFGGISALTNGCEFFYESDTADVEIAFGPLKTNWDFVRMAFAEPSFGDGKGAFLAKDVEGKVDAYIPIIDFRRYMPPYGIKLDLGSNQRIVLRVRDDTRGVDSFNAVGYGFDRFK